jgi:hypothetical protein
MDAIEAYGDNHGLKKRNLNWRGLFMGASAVSKVMKVSVPDGYNDFDADLVSSAVLKHPSYKWAFAREGSPALYCKGVKSKAELIDLYNSFVSAKADEIFVIWKGKYYDIDPNSTAHRGNLNSVPDNLGSGVACRFWWD